MHGVSLLSVLSHLIPEGLNTESTSYFNGIFLSKRKKTEERKIILVNSLKKRLCGVFFFPPIAFIMR